MSSDVDLHVVYQIANAPIREFPYPHILVRDVFPADYYRELRANLPEESALKTLAALGRVKGSDYPARLAMPLTRESVGTFPGPQRAFWEAVGNWILTGGFREVMIAKFAPYLQRRLGDLSKVDLNDEVLIVRDRTTYSLGPHTDAPRKVLSFLFYLPPDDSKPHLGTSIYLPLDPKFRCEGGPHYHFRKFRRILTMPYVPNTLFAFVKTANSFHGVEPIDEPDVRRDLMLYDIKLNTPPQPGKAAPAAGAAPEVKFSF
jgi:hypothetical protein